jgi:hypothetical protein
MVERIVPESVKQLTNLLAGKKGNRDGIARGMVDQRAQIRRYGPFFKFAEPVQQSDVHGTQC